MSSVDSRLIQLERGTCHTLWHRLDLDFVSDHSDTGRLSAYTGGPFVTVDRPARASAHSKS